MTPLLKAVAGVLAPGCDVPGCDEDPEAIWIDGGLRWLCSDHTVEYLLAVGTGEGSQ